jgi:hypothetical protein
MPHAGLRVHYAATEIMVAARSVLTRHVAKFRHLFGDVLERVPEAQRKVLIATSREYLQQNKVATAELKGGSMSQESYARLRQDLGSQLLAELSSQLQQIEFEESAWCYVHEKKCFVSPRFDPDFKNFLWLEAAGNTCCPWSAMSTGQGGLTKPPCRFWLHGTFLHIPVVWMLGLICSV